LKACETRSTMLGAEKEEIDIGKTSCEKNRN
jgi:hypothetical protein